MSSQEESSRDSSQFYSHAHAYNLKQPLLVLDLPLSPKSIQETLYQKYSSSQSYFYSKNLQLIIKEKRSKTNILYDDIECLCEDEENMRRFYQQSEHDRKISAFKQYYFYHEDCPRLFSEKIEDIYERWHEKKRDLVYKKLKIMYGESYNSSENSDSRDHNEPENNNAITHFLLNVSEYNPYSKKYYLRVQAREQKQRQVKEKQKMKKSQQDISDMNHELSIMLGQINNLSMISTLTDDDEANRYVLKTNVKKPKSKASITSHSQSKRNETKIDFRKKNIGPVTLTINTRKVDKNKEGLEKQSRKIIELKTKVNHRKQVSLQPVLQSIPQKTQYNVVPSHQSLSRPTLQYDSSPKLQETAVSKTKSIFSISSLTNNIKSNSIYLNQNNIRLNPSFSVRLKKDDTRPPVIMRKSGSSEMEGKIKKRDNYQSEKGLRRYDPQQYEEANINKGGYKGQKKSTSLKKFSKNQGEPLFEQFSDKRMTGTISTNFRSKSYRSQSYGLGRKLQLKINPNNIKKAQTNLKDTKIRNRKY